MVEPIPSPIDRGAVENFLGALFGASLPLPVTPVGAGAWSQAYAFSHDRREYVIRFAMQRDDFERDRIAAAFASPALPVPPVRIIGEAFGGYYAITERVHGDFLDDADECHMRRVLPALFAMLDAARAIDLSGSAGYGNVEISGDGLHRSWHAALLAVSEDVAEQRLQGWRKRLAESPYGMAAFETAYTCMASLTAQCPEERHVIHSDLLNRNVFIAHERITGVIDWGCLMYGDWLYDLAWLTFWWPWYPAWRAIDIDAEVLRYAGVRGVGRGGAVTRLRCYEIHIGLRHLAYNAYLGHWSAYEETAARTAAIVDAMRASGSV